jgi:hypothetical protein
MGNEPYIRTEFTLTATINGVEFKDVVSYQSAFALNIIPTCSLTLAAGREVRSGEEATIHKQLESLEPRSKATVTLTIKSTQGRLNSPILDGMKDGTYTIFEGYYAGMGYQRSHNNASYTLHLIHWLDDLNCSSVLNGNWFPGAPHDLAQAASVSAVSELTGGSGSYAAGIPLIDLKKDGKNVVSKSNMEKDLWAEVLKPIFEALAKMKHMFTQTDGGEFAAPGAVDGFENNAAALRALARMIGDAPVPAKLDLDLGGVDALLISISAHEGISRLILNGMAYSSFWSKLTGEIGPSFLFSISPGVTFAQPIPFFAGLQKEYKTIYGEEYNYANFNANVAHLIESINVFYSPQASSGAYDGGVTPASIGYNDPWGRYPEKGKVRVRGNIMARDPPIWLCNPRYAVLWTRETTLHYPAGSTADPEKGKPKSSEGPLEPKELEENVKTSTILTRFCEHWYKSAILGQRYGEMSGKFRLDIAPGSILKIEPPDSAIGQEKTTMWASVIQVGLMINAETHQAGTSFVLSNLRNTKENRDTVHFVKNIPPLYKTAWPGGPLVVGME